jgi:SAM-dependent methyltransferase
MGGLYLLISKPAFRELIGGSDDHKLGKPDLSTVTEVMDDSLFGILLRDAVIGHPQFERMLTWLRSKLLFDSALRARAPLQFLCDLALQCFNNEFVYAESESETPTVIELSLDIHRSLQVGSPCDEHFLRLLAVFAMYRLSVSDWIRSELPGLSLPVASSKTMNVLVAGCGTGIEAVSLAASVSGIRVTGVDLSLPSLAYAKRKVRDLGLTNIELIQADILELAELDQRFDAVLSVGVLHHMREPLLGLRVLVGLVHPGGLLKIGLYSKRARCAVNAVRKIIKERQLAPTQAAIRTVRREILGANRNSVLAGLLRWRDFFTLSGCRDLLFHVQEHQFTLPQVAELAHSAELTILGLSTKHLPREAVRAYRNMAPSDVRMADLGKWEAIEARLPSTFEDMYVIWCRTPRGEELACAPEEPAA